MQARQREAVLEALAKNQDKPNYDHFYNLFGDLMLREGLQLDTTFDWDAASGKCQPGCTDNSGAPQYEREGCMQIAMQIAPSAWQEQTFTRLELSHASCSSLLDTIVVTFTIVTPAFCM
jgi:hypothetical protein